MKIVHLSSLGCLVAILSVSPITGWCHAAQQNSSAARSPAYTVTDLNIALRIWDHGARGNNVKGEIVGTPEKPDGSSVAFLYKNGVLTELPRLDGIESQAISINSKGQIAGVITRPSRGTSGTQVAVVWEKGGIRELGPVHIPLGGLSTGLPVTIGAINDLGEVVGYVSGWESTYSPFVWRNGVMLESDQYEAAEQSKLTSAPPKTRGFLAASLGFVPRGVNGRGQIVGVSHSRRAGGSYSYAMMWRNGKQWDLGALPGGEVSRANAINNRGEVVGTSTVEGTQTEHAFLWQNGEMRDIGRMQRANQ